MADPLQAPTGDAILGRWVGQLVHPRVQGLPYGCMQGYGGCKCQCAGLKGPSAE
eukprot:CAMPEP_0195046024 /NCGR_PEP_ID=MMETSP0347-20130606/20583_1 /TAXON_ID=2932 /ORGANISM="Alexandrium fundyense, Strain CCMP1719" /LENGTH=53 /DNA_ID=CAMNT_0040073965 /DNA_START=8 /DNA_END=166 /DNA_ORIENTATION=+